MSKDTLLKKEWNESDLNRIRNITAKRYGDTTKTQTGYSKQQEEHQEGDIWEEDGKKWTIISGIKQTVTKYDSLKKYGQYPLACPCCKNHFKLHDLNKKMYNIHGKCLNCVIEMETKLKLEGKYEEYEKKMMNLNFKSHLTEFELALDNYANSTNEEFITEQGVRENWVGGGVDREYIKEMKKQIREAKDKLL